VAIGYSVSGQCMASPSAALSVMAGQLYSVTESASYYTTVSGDSLITHYSTGIERIFTPELMPCQYIDGVGAAKISFSVLLVWAIVWGICVLRRPLNVDLS
jgi:hypothetical protein